MIVAEDDPRAADVAALLRTHLEFARRVTPPGHVHALDGAALAADDDITFFSARRDGALLGVGALRRLEDGHLEIKSMHTAAGARESGVGRAILEHLMSVATDSNATRVSLETGTMAAFAPARSLYESAGFVRCEPFGEYRAVPNSVCMTRHLA